MVNWRILNIDGFVECGEAWRIVRAFFGPAIPLKIYGWLQQGNYKAIIRAFSIVP